MNQQNEEHKRRLRSLILICCLTAVVISLATYAWFIGMTVVSVNSFDVKIATTDELSLSLDGETWSDAVTITSADYDSWYQDNTNWWSDGGLIPMSSVGDMDDDVSRMILFEKAGLTPTAGGYKLLAHRADNTGATEHRGYVAFDLFIRNKSGSNYIEELYEDDEEAIYFDYDSEVTVANGGVIDTGIENSVRVGFAQIGRVKGDIDPDDMKPEKVEEILGITCETTYTASDPGVTGICRKAQIWEPNDKAHITGAISWYNKSCKERTDATTYNTAANTCNPVADLTYYPTYAVNSNIISTDNVDVYDGEAYNKYEGSTKLTEVDYFTDTEKKLEEVDRVTFMTLAPNSITKVRIYIWLEGQDVDNYDYASIGKEISVKFGFTKQRYTRTDFPEDPDEPIEPPVQP